MKCGLIIILIRVFIFKLSEIVKGMNIMYDIIKFKSVNNGFRGYLFEKEGNFIR